jgi:hypothetical protein
VCAGHGTPIHVTGQCICYTGYDGDDCGSCALGYQLAAGICQRSYESFLAAGEPVTSNDVQALASTTSKVGGHSHIIHKVVKEHT